MGATGEITSCRDDATKTGIVKVTAAVICMLVCKPSTSLLEASSYHHCRLFDVRRFWRSGDSTSERVLDVLESFFLRLWKIIV